MEVDGSDQAPPPAAPAAQAPPASNDTTPTASPTATVVADVPEPTNSTPAHASTDPEVTSVELTNSAAAGPVAVSALGASGTEPESLKIVLRRVRVPPPALGPQATPDPAKPLSDEPPAPQEAPPPDQVPVAVDQTPASAVPIDQSAPVPAPAPNSAAHFVYSVVSTPFPPNTPLPAEPVVEEKRRGRPPKPAAPPRSATELWLPTASAKLEMKSAVTGWFPEFTDVLWTKRTVKKLKRWARLLGLGWKVREEVVSKDDPYSQMHLPSSAELERVPVWWWTQDDDRHLIVGCALNGVVFDAIRKDPRLHFQTKLTAPPGLPAPADKPGSDGEDSDDEDKPADSKPAPPPVAEPATAAPPQLESAAVKVEPVASAASAGAVPSLEPQTTATTQPSVSESQASQSPAPPSSGPSSPPSASDGSPSQPVAPAVQAHLAQQQLAGSRLSALLNDSSAPSAPVGGWAQPFLQPQLFAVHTPHGAALLTPGSLGSLFTASMLGRPLPQPVPPVPKVEEPREPPPPEHAAFQGCACGKVDRGERGFNWVECPNCRRWFHAQCVGLTVLTPPKVSEPPAAANEESKDLEAQESKESAKEPTADETEAAARSHWIGCPLCPREWPAERSLEMRLRAVLDAQEKKRRIEGRNKEKEAKLKQLESVKKQRQEEASASWSKRERGDLMRAVGLWGAPPAVDTPRWERIRQDFGLSRKAASFVYEQWQKLARQCYFGLELRRRAAFLTEHETRIRMYHEWKAAPMAKEPGAAKPERKEPKDKIRDGKRKGKATDSPARPPKRVKTSTPQAQPKRSNPSAGGESTCFCANASPHAREPGSIVLECALQLAGCYRRYHSACVGLSSAPYSWACDACFAKQRGEPSPWPPAALPAAKRTNPRYKPGSKGPSGIRPVSSSPMDPDMAASCLRLVDELRKDPAAGPFCEPVNPWELGIPAYWNFVPNPMDLGSLRTNVAAGAYSSPRLFLEDLRLIWRNCRAFNQPDSPIVGAGNALELTAERLFKQHFPSAVVPPRVEFEAEDSKTEADPSPSDPKDNPPSTACAASPSADTDMAVAALCDLTSSSPAPKMGTIPKRRKITSAPSRAEGSSSDCVAKSSVAESPSADAEAKEPEKEGKKVDQAQEADSEFEALVALEEPVVAVHLSAKMAELATRAVTGGPDDADGADGFAQFPPGELMAARRRPERWAEMEACELVDETMTFKAAHRVLNRAALMAKVALCVHQLDQSDTASVALQRASRDKMPVWWSPQHDEGLLRSVLAHGYAAEAAATTNEQLLPLLTAGDPSIPKAEKLRYFKDLLQDKSPIINRLRHLVKLVLVDEYEEVDSIAKNRKGMAGGYIDFVPCLSNAADAISADVFIREHHARVNEREALALFRERERVWKRDLDKSKSTGRTTPKKRVGKGATPQRAKNSKAPTSVAADEDTESDTASVNLEKGSAAAAAGADSDEEEYSKKKAELLLQLKRLEAAKQQKKRPAQDS